MKNYFIPLLACCVIVMSCSTHKKNKVPNLLESAVEGNASMEKVANSKLIINPISHATMVLSYGDDTIYIDPTGGAEAFKGLAKPNIILITDIHGDHMNLKTLEALDLSHATIVAPKAVVDKLPDNLNSKSIVILNNGETGSINGYSIEAIPMYNLREDALKFHSKGRGNGYVLTINGERIYISGDTEDIPEMRALNNIDKAFVCMNLPYTMTVENAVSAVLEFKPKEVYPYHYRGTNGFSDVNKFKNLVNQDDSTIKVILLNWYKS